MSILGVAFSNVTTVGHHRHKQQTTDASGQTSADQTQTQSASNSTNSADTTSQASSILAALLGSLDVNSSSQNERLSKSAKRTASSHRRRDSPPVGPRP